MTSRRYLAILGLAVATAALFPGQGWAQEPFVPGAPTRSELDRLFFDLLPYAVAAGVLTGLATGPTLRKLRHHEGVHYPSRVRRFALSTWGLLSLACGGGYVAVGLLRGLPPLAVLTHRGGALTPLLFALLWYVTAYVAIRVPRWSGRYALWPHQLGGGR